MMVSPSTVALQDRRLISIIYIVGDNDVKEDGSNPGADFSKRVSQEVLNGTIVHLPPNMDINDYYLAYGAEATKTLLVGEGNG